MLTAITTILGLLPMATGISFDFRKMALDIGGESSQWWGPMAVAVIFGLGFATLLTLIVVPVLCSLVDSMLNRDDALGAVILNNRIHEMRSVDSKPVLFLPLPLTLCIPNFLRNHGGS